MFFSMCHHAEICISSLQDPNSNWFWLMYVLIVSHHTSFHHPDRTNSNMRRYAFYFCSLLHYYTITFHSSSLFSVLLEFFRMLIYSVFHQELGSHSCSPIFVTIAGSCKTSKLCVGWILVVVVVNVLSWAVRCNFVKQSPTPFSL